MIHDCKLIIDNIGYNMIIGSDSTTNRNWSLHGYLNRYGDLSLSLDENKHIPSIFQQTQSINKKIIHL